MGTLPLDVLKRIVRILSSQTRASICRVSKSFAAASVSVSSLLTSIPRVYQPNHRLTYSELAVIIEDNDYHTFVLHQERIRMMVNMNDNGVVNSYLLLSACKGKNLDIILILAKLGINIQYLHMQTLRLLSNDLYLYHHIMTYIMNHSNILPHPSTISIWVQFDDIEMIEACIEFASGHNYADIVGNILNFKADFRQTYELNHALSAACNAGHKNISWMLIDAGATECYGDECQGHDGLK